MYRLVTTISGLCYLCKLCNLVNENCNLRSAHFVDIIVHVFIHIVTTYVCDIDVTACYLRLHIPEGDWSKFS